MPVTLDGGVLVTALREGDAVRDGALSIREHLAGDAVALRVLELDGSATLRNDEHEEVLYTSSATRRFICPRDRHTRSTAA